MIRNIENRIKQGETVLIAEIGVNYYDIAMQRGITPMEAAKLMIAEAANAGIHAVKFQSYKAETLAAKESPAYWDTSEETTTSQYELFKKYDSFGEKEYSELAEYAEELKIEFLSTPFDIAAADYLEPIMNVYKISSSDLNNLPFIEYLAKKNKPIILSVGASYEEEIDRAVKLIKKHNTQPITLLHCVLEYPTPYEHANLYKIRALAERYQDCIIGYSDHTKPDEEYDVLKMAYSLGAKVIEKHFTLDKTLKGNDHYHAMDSEDGRKILKAFDKMKLLGGKKEITCLDSELCARANARRSLVATRDLVQGTVVTKEMLTWKRPGTGITVDNWDKVIGLKVNRTIKAGDILKKEDIDIKENL